MTDIIRGIKYHFVDNDHPKDIIHAVYLLQILIASLMERSNKLIIMNEKYTINLRFGNKTTKLNVFPSTKVYDVQKYAENNWNIKISSMFNRRTHIDTFSLKEHYIGNNDVIDIYEDQKMGMIQLFVKGVDGKTYTIDIDKGASVAEFMQAVCTKMKIKNTHIRFIYCGKQLEFGKLLSDYRISKESYVHLLMYLKAGMFHITSAMLDYAQFSERYYSNKNLQKEINNFISKKNLTHVNAMLEDTLQIYNDVFS